MLMFCFCLFVYMFVFLNSVSACPLSTIYYKQTGDLSDLPLLCHYPVKVSSSQLINHIYIYIFMSDFIVYNIYIYICFCVCIYMYMYIYIDIYI